jgi:RNA polymerase sigma-70 factor (ECF subfamily)
VRADDEAEFAGLVERQWMFAFRVAWGVLRNMHDAEDAAQEAFLKIFRAKAWRGLRDERPLWRGRRGGLLSIDCADEPSRLARLRPKGTRLRLVNRRSRT